MIPPPPRPPPPPPPPLIRSNFTLILNLDAAECPLYAANQALATALAQALVASKPTTKITQATASFVGCAPYSPTTESSIGMAFNVIITAPEGADVKILEWFNSNGFCSVLPASFCASLPGAVESTEARPPTTTCFLDKVVTQLPSVPALVVSTGLNISQINSQLQNWRGVSSWVVETDANLNQIRNVSIVGDPPAGGTNIGNGALFLRTFNSSAQVAVSSLKKALISRQGKGHSHRRLVETVEAMPPDSCIVEWLQMTAIMIRWCLMVCGTPAPCIVFPVPCEKLCIGPLQSTSCPFLPSIYICGYSACARHGQCAAT